MNGWDLFVAFMFAVLMFPLVAFVVLSLRDERRQKREERLTGKDDAFIRFTEAARRYREHR